MARRVRFRVLEGIAVVTMDAAPVNALSTDLRAGLWAVFQKIEEGAHIKAAVLLGAGRMFSAGGDIGEFGQPAGQPSLPQLCARIEGMDKPVVVAAHGQALGGAFEMMMAAHYRLAAAGTQLGLPEVALGLVPGAGGTQRLPRLIGPEKALQLMVSTRSVEADVARRIGLLDGIVEGDLASGAVRFAAALVAQDKGVRRVSQDRSRMADGRATAAHIATARAALKDNPLHAPQRVIDCVEAAGLLPFEAGLAFEADAFERCVTHPQSIALRHMFMAERRIDDALGTLTSGSFRTVDPMGKAAVARLQKALHGAARFVVDADIASEAEVDAALSAYGFKKVPFGGEGATNGVAGDLGLARRLCAAMVAEGCVMVDQGAVQRPADVDVLSVHGVRFPRRLGGPLRAAQTEGLIALRRDMRDWAQDSEIWAVPPLLDEAIKLSGGFDAVGAPAG
ncbi:enoyl-CoA hydratase/isomerase family protein [Pseudooctadecabacter jejudonensis]|uniref:Putative enoyl-CoA hydratase n=1 Tax=Pseudooctadecabacter jejudonensis TaxID=1391910 RepID=A0A1Y5TFM0_9RHOB|nr:enoyl-CoA hydratase/isomerase family protein [Pseudooctadecabacter jejudonensis]SLN60762.1 putative enoyl-CoA hydratase [Pseudooctadecabacter jejudonensis]